VQTTPGVHVVAKKPRRRRRRPGRTNPRTNPKPRPFPSTFAAGIILAVLGAIAAVLGTYLLTPKQAVQSQRALEGEQRNQDRLTPPFRVEGSGYGDVPSYSSPQVLELDHKPYGAVQDLLANNGRVEIGQVRWEEDTRSQPLATRILRFTLAGQRFGTVDIVVMNVVVERYTAHT